MDPQDQTPFHLEITEDSKTGLSIRLRHHGGIPNILKGIPKDVLRKSRPWIWSSYERRILREAWSMSWPTYRAVRDSLILERSKQVIAAREQGPKRMSWLERRRLRAEQRAQAHDATLTKIIQKDIAFSNASRDLFDRSSYEEPLLAEPKTLTEQMREQAGADVAMPRPSDPRDRSR